MDRHIAALLAMTIFCDQALRFANRAFKMPGRCKGREAIQQQRLWKCHRIGTPLLPSRCISSAEPESPFAVLAAGAWLK